VELLSICCIFYFTFRGSYFTILFKKFAICVHYTFLDFQTISTPFACQPTWTQTILFLGSNHLQVVLISQVIIRCTKICAHGLMAGYIICTFQTSRLTACCTQFRIWCQMPNALQPGTRMRSNRQTCAPTQQWKPLLR
jgi:hypothetical protein